MCRAALALRGAPRPRRGQGSFRGGSRRRRDPSLRCACSDYFFFPPPCGLSSVAVGVSGAGVTRRDSARHGGTGWRSGPGHSLAGHSRCGRPLPRSPLSPLALPASVCEIPALPHLGSITTRISPLPPRLSPAMLRPVQPPLPRAFPSCGAVMLGSPGPRASSGGLQ